MDPSPLITAEQARAVDRLAVDRYGFPGLVLMENAGINATAAILDFLDGELGLGPSEARVGICCGGGNNGGDGYVIARHLATWSVEVTVWSTADPADLTGDAAVNHRIAAAMGLPIRRIEGPAAVAEAEGSIGSCDLVVDALLGTGFHGEIREPAASLVQAVNAARQAGGPAVVAVDVPSGLDADSGRVAGPAVQADLTVTFVAAKRGFAVPGAGAWTGRVVVAGIGTPASLLAEVVADG